MSIVTPIDVLGWLLVGFFAAGGLVAFFFLGMQLAKDWGKKS